MSSSYFVISICYRSCLGFLVSFQNYSSSITIINVFLSILFLVYLLINTPFKRGYHNYRAVVVEGTTLIILGVGMYYRSMKAQESL